MINKNKKGFTLTELLAVIAIIAVVGTLGYFGVNAFQKSTNEKAFSKKIDVILMESAKYFDDNLLSTSDITVNNLLSDKYVDDDKDGHINCEVNGKSINELQIEVGTKFERTYACILDTETNKEILDGVTLDSSLYCNGEHYESNIICPRQNKSYEYNGTPISSGIICPKGSYISGDINGTNAGSYTLSCVPNNGYTFDSGTCNITWTINKRSATCISGSSDKSYDGVALTNTNGGTCTGLISGDSAVLSGHTGTITDAGNTPNTFGSVVITNSSGVNVTENYNIKKEEGTLTVNTVQLSVQTVPVKASSLTYNGKDQTLVSSPGSCSNGAVMQYRADNSNQTSYGTSIPKAMNAKNYVVYYKCVSNNSNYTDSDEAQISSSIKQIVATCISGSASKSYDGVALTSRNTGSCTGLLSGDTATFSEHTGSIIDAGTAPNAFGKIVIKNASGVNVTESYNITKKNGTLRVNPVQIGVLTKPTAIAGLTYTGASQKLIKAGTCASGSMQYRVGTTGSFSTTLPSKIDAKSYTVYYKCVASNENYIDSDVNSIGVTINAANATCPTIAAYSGTYDGSAHSITVSGGSGGTIKYRTSSTGTWSTTKPSITNVDKSPMTIYVEVDGDKNYNTVDCGSSTVTIKPQAITVTNASTISGLKYNGTSLALVNAGSCSSGAMQYKADNSNQTSYGTGIPKATKVGTYTVYYKCVSADSNHTSSSEKSVNVEIGKLAITCTSGSATKNYNGTALTNTTGGSCRGLASGDSATFSGHSGTITNTGSVPNTFGSVVIKNSGGTVVTNNYSITKVNGTLTITNNRASVNTNPSANSLSYTGSNLTLVSAGSCSNGTMQYKAANSSQTTYGTGIPKATDAGDYIVFYKCVSSDSNYNDSDEEKIDVTIARVDATCPTLTAYSGTYDGSAHSITVSGGSGGTIQYRTSTTGTWTTTKPSITNASDSTMTTYVRVLGDGNHNDKNCESSTVTITKKSVTITKNAEPINSTYTGGNINLLTAGACSEGGTMKYKASTGTSYKANIPYGLKVGTYTIYYKCFGDNANYIDSAEKSISMTISGNTTLTFSPKKALVNIENKYNLTISADRDGVLTITQDSNKASVDKSTINMGANSNYTLTFTPKSLDKNVAEKDVKFTFTFTPNKKNYQTIEDNFVLTVSDPYDCNYYGSNVTLTNFIWYVNNNKNNKPHKCAHIIYCRDKKTNYYKAAMSLEGDGSSTVLNPDSSAPSGGYFIKDEPYLSGNSILNKFEGYDPTKSSSHQTSSDLEGCY